MLPNNFIFSETESLFQSKLDSNEIKNTAIAFMADTGRIWTHGVWFCTALTAEDIQNLIDQSTTLQEFLQSLSPAEVSVSDTQPTGEEKIWINGNTISFNNGGSWSTPINLDNFLSKNNELEYTPVGDYNPATKKYVDDQIVAKDNVLIVDATDFAGSPLDGELVNSLITAAQNGKAVIMKSDLILNPLRVEYKEVENQLILHLDYFGNTETGYNLNCDEVVINTVDNTFTNNIPLSFNLVTNGDGLKYLSDDGSYKTFPDMATVVELNASVLALTSGSSSEEIIAAFDSTAEFSNLITQIRDSDNIVNEVLLDTDGYIGHINASLAVSKTDEVIHIRFIDNNDKLVFITVTNNAGTFSCTRTDKDLVNDPVTLVSDGDGNLFLANDGTYKEATSSSVVIPVNLKLNETLGDGGSGDGYDFSQIYNAYISGKTVYLKDSSDNLYLVINALSNGVIYYAINTTGAYSGKPALYQFKNRNYGGAVGTVYEINIINDPGNILFKDNTSLYTPTSDYNPATKLYVDDSIKAAVGSVYKIKGSVANYEALPTSDVEIGDVYNLIDTGANYVAINNDPIEWDKLSETVDTSVFLAKDNTTEFTPTGEYNPATKGYVDNKATTSSITIPSVPIYTPDPDSDPEEKADLVTGDNLQTIIGKLLYKIQSLETELANFKAAVSPEGQSIVYINK